jgi:predicted nucleic acid-binding protein
VRLAYFDSSAIVKLVHLEPESQALIDYLASDEIEVSTSVVAEIEVIRALRRLRDTKPEIEQAMKGFYLLGLDEEVRQDACSIGATTLRSLDAVHLATALAIDDDELEFITYDDRLADAARSEGLTVVQPGR